MKQIIECLDRTFNGVKPLKKKWQSRISMDNDITRLYLFHYQHLVLVFNITNGLPEFMWWEKDADRRGLVSACLYLKDNDYFEFSLSNKYLMRRLLISNLNEKAWTVFAKDMKHEILKNVEVK